MLLSHLIFCVPTGLSDRIVTFGGVALLPMGPCTSETSGSIQLDRPMRAHNNGCGGVEAADRTLTGWELSPTLLLLPKAPEDFSVKTSVRLNLSSLA